MRDRRGGIAILAGVSLTAMVGMAAFAIDLGVAYSQRGRLQLVADSAAMAGAVSWTKTGSATAVAATVRDVVVVNGWPASIIQTSLPPTSALPNVTVSLLTTSSLTLSQVVSALQTVSTRGYAVASVRSSSSPACVLALSTLMVNGSIDANGCSIEANAASSNAITVNSGGSLTAKTIATPGGITRNGTITGTIKTGTTAATDPYSGTQNAAGSGFTGCQSYASQTTLNPGCWNNVNINGSVKLNAGTYFFPTLNVNSGSSLTGTGVTIVAQNVNIGSSISITAPTTGTWAGVAIYSTNGMNLNSGVTYAISGAIYSPTGTVIMNGGTWNQLSCTYIVAQNIISNGGASFKLPQNNCASYGFPVPGMAGKQQIALVQ